MMKAKYYKLILLLIQVSSGLYAQERVPIYPIKDFSMGGRDHTSRDVLIQTEKDAEGNLLLLGTVEGDSIYADGTLQKITPDGNLIWEYRMDSHTANNYDIPVKMAIDLDGNATILVTAYGLASFFEIQRSNSYLLKIDTAGHLLWRIDLDTLLQPHLSATHVDGFMDDQGIFNVKYSTFIDYGNAPTYFLQFGNDGTVLNSFTKTGIEQGLIGHHPSALTQGVDSFGNFIFIHRDENTLPHLAIRQINPATQEEYFFPFDTNALSSLDKHNFRYVEWSDIRIDAQGAILSATNVDFIYPGKLFFSKVNADGSVAYVIHPDSIDIRYTSMEPWHDSVIMTGTYKPKNSDHLVSFLWVLDENGNRVMEKIESVSHSCVPRFLSVDKDNVYWATQDLYSGELSLKELNAENFDVQWEYFTHHDLTYIFTGTTVVDWTDGNYSFAGTLRKEKQPGSGFTSEEELYVESFYSPANTLTGQYRMTEKGTTFTEIVNFSQDPQGNYIVKTQEVNGAEKYTIQRAPRIFYYHKFDADLNLLWTIPAGQFIAATVAFEPFYFDKEGNIYTVEVDSLFILKKISPDGIYLNAYPLIDANVYKIFIDRQDRIHLSLYKSNGELFSEVLDTEFNLIDELANDLYTITMFQLAEGDDVYYYLTDRGADPNEHETHIFLYKNGLQEWERTFSFVGAAIPFSDFELDVNTGDLVTLSFWPDALGLPEPQLHRFTINGTHTHEVIYHQFAELVNDIKLMPNGNVFTAFDDRLDLYNPAFQFIRSTPVDSIPAGGYYFTTGNRFYRAHKGMLDGFNQKGEHILSLAHESFYFDPAQIKISEEGKLITASIFGEVWESGYDYGWWRSRIQIFDISNLHTSLKDETESSLSTISCFPNPASNNLTIALRDLHGKQILVTLYSVSGECVLEKTFTHSEQDQVELNLNNLPVGLYFLRVHTGEEMVTDQIVVIHE